MFQYEYEDLEGRDFSVTVEARRERVEEGIRWIGTLTILLKREWEGVKTYTQKTLLGFQTAPVPSGTTLSDTIRFLIDDHIAHPQRVDEMVQHLTLQERFVTTPVLRPRSLW
jgi:hypothetical protein